jgi:hypothetical protein
MPIKKDAFYTKASLNLKTQQGLIFTKTKTQQGQQIDEQVVNINI